jgi:hypothetical protein
VIYYISILVNDAFKWKLQSILKLAQLGAEQLDLVDVQEVISELSKGDRDMVC